MRKIINNCVGCWKHIPYTVKHYFAFHKVKRRLGQRGYWFHDLDKLFLFIFFPYLGEEKIGLWHRFNNKHHAECTKGHDWIEAVINWECARITKPDKPLNARQTWEKYYFEYSEVEEYLNQLNL